VRKKYRVEISSAAKADVRSTFDHIAADNRHAAERWVENVEQLILRLRSMPRAYEVIPEAADLRIDCRHKLFGDYRIIYRIEADTVYVVRIIHGARLLDASMFQ
jgi:plasmid stabilization system protein ParE